MKRLYTAILFAGILVISFNCQKEISYTSANLPGTFESHLITTALEGNIVNENGQPVAGVVIKVGNKNASTNSKGYFRIDKAALDKNVSVVTAEKSGYFKAIRSFSATSGDNYIKIKLVKKSSAGTISSAAGGSVTLANGSKVTLSSNAVVKASGGAAYTGSINVYASYIDPAAADIAQTVPGSFMADDKDNRRVILKSYGMLAVELESSSGEKLQIAPGSVATLTTPIPSSLLTTAPATIPLWYVDERTGLWKEEGAATKNGNNYVGDVKHFSFWNCDQGFPAINLSLTLKEGAGIPIAEAEVRLTRIANELQGYGWTDVLGQVSGLVPVNENLLLEILDPCGNVVYSRNIGPFTTNTDLGVISLPNFSSSSLLTIKGRLKSCNGALVTNGFAIINYENSSRHSSVNNNGEFASCFITCAGSPSTCAVTGVDAAASQQSDPISVAITLPVTNSGDIFACGVSAVQFINYAIDGTQYSLTSAANDSLVGYTYGSNQPYYSWISGNNSSTTPSNSRYLTLYFSHDPAPGTYNVNSISVQSNIPNDSAFVVAPFTITLTNYPANAGGFFEGTFTGRYKYLVSGAIHNIAGSFRVRKY